MDAHQLVACSMPNAYTFFEQHVAIPSLCKWPPYVPLSDSKDAAMMMMAIIITRKLSFEQCAFCTSVSIQTMVQYRTRIFTLPLTAMTVRTVVLIPGPTTVVQLQSERLWRRT
jgi:hypothetical protein